MAFFIKERVIGERTVYLNWTKTTRSKEKWKERTDDKQLHGTAHVIF